MGCLHHPLEVRAVQVSAGKAFVFIDDHRLRIGIPIVSADIFLAQFDLVADALALAGKL